MHRFAARAVGVWPTFAILKMFLCGKISDKLRYNVVFTNGAACKAVPATAFIES